MPRISQLPSLTSADNSDEIAIVDVSASTTKKITRGDLLKAPLPANSVTTAAIQDGAVKASNVDFSTFQAPAEAVGPNSGSGSNNVTLVTLNYDFIAGRRYLILASCARVDRASPGVIETRLRVGTNVLNRYRTFGGSGTPQVGVTMQRLYTPSSTSTESVNIFVRVLTGGNGFDYEFPVISVVPLPSSAN